MGAVFVAVSEGSDRNLAAVAVANSGETPVVYNGLDHPAVVERINGRLSAADAVVVHGASHWMPRLIDAGLAPRSAVDRVVCTRDLARLGRPNSVAANGAMYWDTANAVAGLVAPPAVARPAGPLGMDPRDVAGLAAATATVFPAAYAAAAERLSPELVRRDLARMRSTVSSGCAILETDSPVTDSEPAPVPVPVAGVTRNQFDFEPQPVYKRVSLVEGISPAVALYAPARKVAAVSASVVALAESHGIDLDSLTGSGVGGRVIMADVKKAIKEESAR
jgi:pyruvate/2-oxoglutarate dehydrogenase complex dihydrolipoamide acyltransferase (E2) component